MAERRGDIELRYNATALDYILLLPLFGKMFLAVIARLLIRPFSKRPKPRTLLKDVVFTILRTFLGGVNVAQDTLFSISTADGYASFVKKNKLPATETVLGSGLKAFWFGPKSADKIVLFFHGGGYAKAASPGHFAWLHDLQKDLAAKGHSVSVFLPAYEVTTDRPSPKGRYPIQLQQAAESLAWLIEKEHKKPSDVCLPFHGPSPYWIAFLLP
jgi:acetyl esterase/lipase